MFAKEHRRQLRLFYTRITTDYDSYASNTNNRLLSRYAKLGLLDTALQSAIYFYYTTPAPPEKQAQLWAFDFYRLHILPQERFIEQQFAEPTAPFGVQELEHFLRV